MGRLIIGAGALLLCVGLTACDEKHQTKTGATASRQTVTVEKSCDCRPTITEKTTYPDPPRYVRHRAKAKTYRQHHAARTHHDHARVQRDEFYSGGYHGESAEIQGRSHSRNSYRQEHHYYDSEEMRPMDRDARYSRTARSSNTGSGRWVDGYGRIHYATAQNYHTGPMVVNSRQGRSTWHGYGVRCADPTHHHSAADHYGADQHTDHSKVGHGFD